MANEPKVVRDIMATIDRDLKALSSRRVLVGYAAENALREPEAGEEPDPLTNAAIAYIMENGAPEANIPPRPSLYPGVADAQDKITRRFQKAAEKIGAGEEIDVDVVLAQVGLTAQNAVRARITNGPHIPLKASTLASRRARGRTGEKPLIDTSQMRNAVTYVVRNTDADS